MWALWAVFGCGCVMLIYAIAEDFKNYSKNKEQNEVKSMEDNHADIYGKIADIYGQLSNINSDIAKMKKIFNDWLFQLGYEKGRQEREEQKAESTDDGYLPISDKNLNDYLGKFVKITFKGVMIIDDIWCGSDCEGYLFWRGGKEKPYVLTDVKKYNGNLCKVPLAKEMVEDIELCEVKNGR